MLMKKKNRTNLQGQALIIILLAMSVVMTVVLSSVSRSVTEVVTTTYEEDALRAFSAAEAGVEEKLLDIGTVGSEPKTVELDTTVSYTVGVEDRNVSFDADGKQIEYLNPLSSGEAATFLFTSRGEGGQFVCDGDNPCWVGTMLRMCYGSPGSAVQPAIELSVYYDTTYKSIASPNNYADVAVFRRVYDNVSGRTPGAVTASTSGCFDDGSQYKYRAVFNLSAPPSGHFIGNCSTGSSSAGCILFVKVRMLYEQNQPLAFWIVTNNPDTIPSQGVLISSEGVAGDAIRRVEVYRYHPEPLNLFDSAVFSLNGLTK